MTSSIQTIDIPANGFTFRCRTSGDKGEPVILLHGFPETSHMWIPLMDHLAGLGYQCLAPDQRGYCPGARPKGAENYHYSKLCEDVIALADHLGYQKFHLVGHDHGAGVGWTMSGRYPERIQSWTAMSVPHIAGFGDAIRNDADQTQRSQYIGFFQQEGVAEKMFSEKDFDGLKRIWDKCSDEQKEIYLAVFKEEYALSGALNWYRGSIQMEGADATGQVGQITTPTLMIWGNQDSAIGRKSVESTPQYMEGPYRFVELDVGHWLIQENEDRILTEVRTHIQANGFNPGA